MSDYEYHYGNLRLLPKLDDESLEHQCERICLERNIETTDDESFTEQLKYNDKFHIYNDNLYDVFDHDKTNDCDTVMRIFPNPDGTLTFIGQFYNGGTYLGEMLDESLDYYFKCEE
jgi:hypothetical protein